jgi:WD40 repeat protein
MSDPFENSATAPESFRSKPQTIVLRADTRVAVVPIAIDEYAKPTAGDMAGATQFDALPRIKDDLVALRRLFESDAYRTAGFQMLNPIRGSAGFIVEELTHVQKVLTQRPALAVILFWTGHGRTVQDDLRLVTQECFHPIRGGDGLPPGEVVNKLANAEVRSLFVLLDVCQAAAASADLITSAAKRFSKSAPETPFGLSALFSAYPFENAKDGFFVDAFVRLMSDGPSAEALKEMAVRQREAINPHNRLLYLKEIEEALKFEIEVARKRMPTPSTAGVHLGDTDAIFPNPLFRRDAPAVNVEEARRLRILRADVDTHFLPKARGLEPGEDGWFFSGRQELARKIVQWPQQGGPAGPHNLFVLTGEGGTGKSAVIGRFVTLCDEGYRAAARDMGWDEAADQLDGTAPRPGAIDAALHLRKLTAQQVTQSLTELLELKLGDTPMDVESFVGTVPIMRAGTTRPITIAFDALDESNEPARIADALIRPLAKRGWRILVATRHSAADRGIDDLLALLGPAHVHSLDDEPSTEVDIADYVERRLASTPGSPYAGLPTESATISSSIAQRASGKFLYARITTAGLLRRREPIDVAQLGNLLAANLYDALTDELQVLDVEFHDRFGRTDAGATALFTALAWAEGEGLPLRDRVWPTVATAVVGSAFDFAEEHAMWLLREGGRFIVESGDGDQAVYRVFHHALNEHFRARPDSAAVSEHIANALSSAGAQASGWERANLYLVDHLPAHLAQKTDHGPLRLLLLSFGWMHAKCTRVGVQALLADYSRSRVEEPPLKRLERTLSMSAHILRRSPQQLAPQLLGRLPLASGPELAVLHDAARNWRGRDWLMPVRPYMEPAGPLLRVLEGHDGEVESVAFSCDGTRIVSCGADQTLRHWDARSGEAVDTPLCHEHSRRVGFSPNGTSIVSENGGVLRLWDAKSGEPISSPVHVIGHHLTCVAVRADGMRIVAGMRDGTLLLWDLESGKALGIQLLGHEDNVGSVAFSPDGTRIVSGSEDQTLRLWDANSGESIGGSMKGHKSSVDCVAFSPDGMRIVSGSHDRTLRLWDARSGEPNGDPLQGPQRGVTSVAFSSDGTRIASGHTDGMLRLWNVDRGEAIGTPLNAHEIGVSTIAFSPTGTHIVSGGQDGTMRLWDVLSDATIGTALERHESSVSRVTFSTDGTRVVSGSSDHTLRIWNAQSGESIGVFLRGHLGRIASVAFSPDGTQIVAGSDDGTLRRWNVQSGEPIGDALRGHEYAVTAVAFSSDGTRIFSGAGNGMLRLWDARDGEFIGAPLDGREAGALFPGATSIAFSPNGSSIVFGYFDRTLRLWDVQSGKPLGVPLQGNELPVSVAFSPDGTRLASGDEEGTLQLWDAASCKAIGASWKGHSSRVTSIAFSADGTLFASGSWDQTLRLWDAKTRQLACELDLDSSVVSVAMSKERVAVGQRNGVVPVLRLVRATFPD